MQNADNKYQNEHAYRPLRETRIDNLLYHVERQALPRDLAHHADI